MNCCVYACDSDYDCGNTSDFDGHMDGILSVGNPIYVENDGLVDYGIPHMIPQHIVTSVSTTDNAENPIYEAISPMGKVIKVYVDCASGKCDCVYTIGKVVSQLKPCRFASLILNETLNLKDDYREMLWYVTDGFPIVDSAVEAYECFNYSSITCDDNRIKMDLIIERELKEGMISLVVEKPTCVHALGAVPKSNGGIRHITDCSRPLGKSVNNHCESILQEFCFKSVEDVVALLDEGSFMTVIDIKAAYRAVPIREDHRKYQGFSWVYEGKKRWFVDNRMCFGLRLGPMNFNLLSNFVFDIASKKGLKIINYLDDFLAVSNDFDSCVSAQSEIISLLRFLGFHVAFEKLVTPSTCVTYLGIEIDSVGMEFRLPQGKLNKLRELLDYVLSLKRVSKKDLESLGGTLSHCSQVVKGGKIFSKSIYTLYKHMVFSNKKYVVLPEWVRADLTWWKKLSVIFNGSSKIVKISHEEAIVSDSSMKGFGVYMGSDWCAGTWHDCDTIVLDSPCNHVVSKPVIDVVDFNNINVLELWPVLVGIKRWSHRIRDKNVVVFTDNTQVMFMLLNGKSSNITCMQWIRELFWTCAIYNIEITPKYICTESNLVADTLSRVPYENVNSKLPSLLHGSNLCCLNLLFENYREKQGGSGQEGRDVPV